MLYLPSRSIWVPQNRRGGMRIGSRRTLLAQGRNSLYNGLVAFYPLNETSGAAIDVIGGLDLTDNNTVTNAVGKIGGARQYTCANSEYHSRADHAMFSMGDISFVLAGWVYFDNVSPSDYIFSKWDAAQIEYYCVMDDADQKIVWAVSNDGTATTSKKSAVVCTTSTWHHVYVEHNADADTIGISVDNETLATAAHAGGVLDGANAFTLGSLAALAFHSGRLDAWGVWRGRVWTVVERTRHFAGIEPPW